MALRNDQSIGMASTLLKAGKDARDQALPLTLCDRRCKIKVNHFWQLQRPKRDLSHLSDICCFCNLTASKLLDLHLQYFLKVTLPKVIFEEKPLLPLLTLFAGRNAGSS